MILLPLLTIKDQASKIVPVPTYNGLVKSLKTVTPAEAGVQNSLNLLDSRFRRNDKNGAPRALPVDECVKCG